MSLHQWIGANPRTVRLCRIIGVSVFAIAFLLPACKFGGGRSELINLGTYSGWKCAWFSLMLAVAVETYRSPFILAVLGGLINPMIVVFLACYTPRFVCLRRILSWAILFCLVATWAFFAIDQFIPLIGHFLWVVGIGMILASQLPPPEAKTTGE